MRRLQALALVLASLGATSTAFGGDAAAGPPADDPRAALVEKRAAALRDDPAFKDVAWTRLFADPYVVFQEVKQIDVRDTTRKYDDKTGTWIETPVDGTTNPAKVMQNAMWAEKAAAFARRDAALLVEMHRRFRELFVDDMKLPTMNQSGRALTVLVFWNRASFDVAMKAAGEPKSPSTRAFYWGARQMVVTYIGDESLMELDELPTADGWVQKESDEALLHEATSQLLHEYAAIARGRPLADGKTDPIDEGPAWFQTGLAEFLSVVETQTGVRPDLSDAKWRHERVALHRVLEARRERELAQRWTLADVTSPQTADDVGKIAASHHVNDDQPMWSLAVRSWAFCHFLWNYDGGKYRPKFVAFVREALEAPTTSARFAEMTGRPSAAEWGPLEMEFEWYWDRLLERHPGRDPKTREVNRVPTDAPPGRVEDDPDWIGGWKAAHGGK